MSVKLSPTHKKSIFILLFLIPFLLGMGIDSFVPSLPAVSQYFHASSHTTQLTISFYMLGYALGQIILGVLSDSLGRRKIVLFTGAFFVVVSLAAPFSPNIYILILCRFLQGCAIAGPGAACRAIATDCFTELELSKAMTFIASSWALGPILGPFIGSYLQHYFSWKANFYFLGLYSLGTFLFAAIALKETHQYRMPFHLPKMCGMLKEALTHPLFLIYALIGSIIYSALVIFNVIAPFLIQIDLHYSVIDYGHMALVLGLSYFSGNLLNRFLMHYMDPLKLVGLGISGAVLMALIMTGLSLLLPLHLWIILAPSLILFCLCGMIFPNMMGASARIFPHMGGTSSAVFGSFVSGGVFILSSFVALLPTHNSTPMALMYLAIFAVSLLLFIISKRLK